MTDSPSAKGLVSQDPKASKAERMADKAHDPVIVLNYLLDCTYAPYCMRCSGLKRMKVTEPFRWECDGCGGVHDERQVMT